MQAIKYFTINDDFEKIIKKNLFFKPIKIEKIENGWTNFVFSAKTIAGTYFFRFPRNDFFSETLVKEVSINKFLNEYLCIKTSKLKLKYFEEKKLLANDIAKFILNIQKIDYEKLNLTTLSTFLENLSKVVSSANIDYNLNVHTPLIENEKNFVFCHGDLNPGNIIIGKNNKIKAILDFAFATKSDNLIDLARICGRLPEDFRKMIIDAFDDISPTKANQNLINEYIKLWSYVDNSYISYMKKACPDVVVPEDI